MEHQVLQHMDACQSSKRTERKKSIAALSELLRNPDVIQILHDNFESERVNWNALFIAVNHSLILESECWKADEAKGSSSASVTSARENSKSAFVSLVGTVLTKANLSKPTIKCEDVVGACAKIFSDPYLLKNFGTSFFGILQENVFPVRKYRTSLKSDQWFELFNYVFDYLKTQEEDSQNWATHCAFELMESVVYYGCQQSYLSTQVKNKLLPYLEAKFNTLYRNAAVQNALLSLTLCTCITVAKDTRTGVCQLGESILATVIHRIDPKEIDTDHKNKVAVDFLLFQVQCHHPKGATQGNDAAYACNWNTWGQHMYTIYRIVFSIILKRENALVFRPLSNSFLDLAVELCHQLFDKSKATYEVSVTFNETGCPDAKRRKCAVSMEELFDQLQLKRKDTSCWPLITLVSKILEKYPELFQNNELYQLVELLVEMQCNPKNQETRNCVYGCCEQLIRVMAERNLSMDLWLRVWETSLRSAGLNHSDCLPVLQTLIVWRIPPTSGLESLIRMFQSSMIHPSNDSLRTLMALLTYYHLPESSDSAESVDNVAVWERPMNQARVLLLRWICSIPKAVKIDVSLVAKVLAILVVKVRNDQQSLKDSKPESNTSLKERSFESDYCVNAFEAGLLLPSSVILSSSATNPKFSYISSSIVDSISLTALEMLMETKCVELEQKFSELCAEGTAATQGTRNSSSVLKLKVDLTCDIINYTTLITNLMSLLMEYGAISDEFISDCYLNNRLERTMQLLMVLLPKILEKETKSNGRFLKEALKVLQFLGVLYGSDLLPSMSVHLRGESVQEILSPVVNLFSISGIANDDVSFWNDLEGSPIPIILEGSSLKPIDCIHAYCLNILTLYGCPKRGAELISKQKTVISRILKVLADSEIYDMKSESTFMMVNQSLTRILAYPCLDPDKHLIPILKLLQSACMHWNQDAEASFYILSLLRDIYKHVSTDYSTLCSIKLFAPFKNRKFGPKFTKQLISCFEEIFRVDQNSRWARWKNSSSLRQAVDSDSNIPAEALLKFEDDDGNQAVVEEVVFYLLSPFQEVRLAAVPCVAGLFSGSHHSLLWMKTMFERLTVVLSELFIIKEDLYENDAISNRTSVVLHVLSAIIASNSKCYNQALLLIFRIMKEAELNSDLVKKVFKILGTPMKLQSVQSFIGKSLSPILHNWLLWGYQLQEFPFVLLNFTTFSEFMKHCKGTIMPVIWKHKGQERHLNLICEKVELEPAYVLKESFASIYAQYLPVLADRQSNKSVVSMEIKQYKLFEALLGNGRIPELVSSSIDDILIEVSNLVWDTSQHEKLLGLDPSSTVATPPFISQDSYSASLEYLQNVIQIEEHILVYIGRTRPIVMQKVLIQLRENVSAAVTLDQSVKALHSYASFTNAVAFHLQNGEYPNLEVFLLQDITHTLLYMIHENESDPIKVDVCIGSCCFLTKLFEQILPACAPTVSAILPTIIGFLIPLSQETGVLAKMSLKLLELLVVTNSAFLKDAISNLPPFPDTPNFEEINNIHKQYKYQGNEFTLEDELKHFLNSTGSTSLANHHTMFDALKFLRKQLSEKKTELAVLYQGLELTRGFSQDCKESILHQLICKLVSLGSSSNKKVQIEASCCLGELGPTELTTLVLKPMEGCIDRVMGYSNPILCVMILASHLSSGYLFDYDISVVRKASCALESLMACKGSDAVHRCDVGSNVLKSKTISPFIPQKATKPMPSLLDEKKVVDVICDTEIWCPDGDVKHKEWVTNLACALLSGLSDDEVFRHLACLCKVKTSFAEEMLPVLFYLGLSYSADVCHKLCIRLGQFFENHCCSSLKTSQTSFFSGSPSNIFMDGASVQCMLNVVNYVRQQMSALKDKKICLELNYLHIASAAQFCCAYLSSIMYLELWCNTEKRDIGFDGTSVAYVDHIYEIQPKEGKMLQNLLSKAYEQIGDKDALYGCGTSMLLNPESRVRQYEYIGKWDKALLYYDSKLLHENDVYASSGMVTALKHCGHLHLLNTFIESLPSDKKNHLLPAQIECMWRLGQWGTPLSSSSKMTGFEWNQYSALEAIRNGNKAVSNECVAEGRLSVLNSLAHSSLEICKTVYKPLAQLQALQEIEDFVKSDDIQEVFEKWKNQSTLPFSDISLLEPILAQRAKLMENLNFQKTKEDSYSQNTSYLLQKITQHYLDTAALARKEDQIQVAEQWLHSLSVMPHLSNENRRQICLEEAQLAWGSCRGTNDAGTASLARNLLKSLLKELQASEKVASTKSLLLPKALILYGKWMAEACSENPQQIIEDYLEEALLSLNRIPLTDAIDDKLEAHCCLAHFADLEYQRISAYIKSESFQSKIECMETLRSEANEANQKVKEGAKDLRQAVTLGIRFSDLDEEEIKNTYQDRNQFIELAMKHYLISMERGQGESLPVFRMVSLWLENASHDAVNNLVISRMDSIQTYKLIVLLPQLAARIGARANTQNAFTEAIYKLLLRCCLEHPYHTLPLILALANSYEDFEGKVKPNPEARVVGATQMLSELQRNKLVSRTVDEMNKLSKALISLAYAEIPAQNANKGYSIAKAEKICQLRNLQHAMLPIIALPVQTDAKYSNIISIHSFDSRYELAGGINKPKKIMCLGSDGLKRPLLVKGRDDLRQDAVMQQVFNIMNTLLKACKETKCRRLLIRTYKIVPLSQRCGVLEWCQNTSPLQEVLLDVHCRYYAEDWKHSICMKKIDNARQKSNLERLHVFKEICKNFHPAFRFFFTERFPTPAEWFDHRLAYVHSVATNSMVGYILGLGDRHVSNILIDKTTAELIHIDFGIAFEQGKVLPTPETVPFRLTRDLVDGMGLSGVEGVFRRSCERAMAVLRRNQEKILTILEVLLYDPLYAWTITPKVAAKHQKGTSSRSSVISDSEGNVSNVEKNKMAERALCRLKEKLQGTEDGPVSSIEGQVNRLIQQARDPANLSRLFKGWQAYF